MPNLLEALQPQMQDTTSQLSTLLRAKSGKAVGGPATALSTQQEQASLAQATQAMQPVQQAATTQQMGQQQQARELEQRTIQEQSNIAQQRQANQLQSKIQTDRLLQELEQGRGQIDANIYKASLEQIGQNLRLSNQQYIDNLQREGNRARLNDNLQFSEQMARSVLEDNKSLLEKQLGNKSILAASDREFSTKMAQMGVKNAWTLFRNDASTEQQRQLYTGIGGVISAGIGAYGTYQDRQERAEDRKLLRQQGKKE